MNERSQDELSQRITQGRLGATSLSIPLLAEVQAFNLRPYEHDIDFFEDVRLWARARLLGLFGGQREPNPFTEAVEHRNRFQGRLERTRQRGTRLRIDELAERFGLNALDLSILQLLLVIEGDFEFHQQRRQLVNDDDFHTAGLLVQLVASDQHGAQRVLERLGSRQPLVHHRLIYLNTPAARRGTGTHNHLIELDESVMAFVVGRAYWPAGLDPIFELHAVTERPGQAYFARKLQQLDRAVRRESRQDDAQVFIVLCGVTVDTNRQLALTWASQHDRPTLGGLSDHSRPSYPP